MSRITRNLRQKAMYWAPNGENEFGNTTYAEPVEISVRWTDIAELTVTKDGRTVTSKSKVMVDQDVEEGGLLWLGTEEDWEDTTTPEVPPTVEEGGNEIVLLKKIPNRKATEFLRIAML